MVNLPLVPVVMVAIHVLVVSGSKLGKPPALFVFGDSYLDSGNNNYINTSTQDQANFSPYGETYFHNWTGRFSDGRIISDFLVHMAGWENFIQPYLNPSRKIDQNYNGVSFASAGAGVLPSTLPGFSISLKQQLQYYKDEIDKLIHIFGSDKAKKITENAVYLITFGANDVIVSFELNTPIPDKHQFVKMMIGNFSTVINTIYGHGGRKFVLQNVLDLGCSPGLKILKPDNNTGPCLKNASEIVKLYNMALEHLASDKTRSLPGSNISILDLAGSVARRTCHPSIYGFGDVEDACCGYGPYNGRFSCGGKRPFKNYTICLEPNDYVYWDSFHLTDRAYESITFGIWNQSSHLRGLFGRVSRGRFSRKW